MMKKTLPLLAFAAAALIASPVFAMSDGGSSEKKAADAGGSGAPAMDAGSMSDAGMAGDATATADTGSGDVVDPPKDTTSTGGSFNENPCWDEKCPKETKACKDDKNCNAYVTCTKSGKSGNDCAKDLGIDEAAGKALEALLTPMQDCGWKACNDPTKGSCKDQCGKYLGRKAPCNCDDACSKYGDCCSDYEKLCGGDTPAAGSCKDNCGKPPASKGACGCDDKCTEAGDCCSDYKALCKSTPCQPKCDGKSCGDDGCGGSCGSCKADAVCDATGQCVTKGGSVDAGSTDNKDAGATATDAGGAKADAATGTGGGTTAAPAKSSGGCTAGPTSNGTVPFALVLSLLAGLVFLRRRDEA